MRKKFYHERVCCCSPKDGMVYMNARMLYEIINREIHPIRCASTCGRKAQKALVLGELCVEAHHPLWALKIWRFAIHEIHNKDYDDWITEWFNPQYVSLQDVISDGICEILGRKIDDVERQCGINSASGIESREYWAGDGWYDSLRYEKYDYCWDSIRDFFIKTRDDALANQSTQRIFIEGQGELPPYAQDFFSYWEGIDPTTQDLYFRIDDWS